MSSKTTKSQKIKIWKFIFHSFQHIPHLSWKYEHFWDFFVEKHFNHSAKKKKLYTYLGQGTKTYIEILYWVLVLPRLWQPLRKVLVCVWGWREECNTQRNLFGILLIQTKFGLQLPFSFKFSTKRNSDWC